MYTITTPSIYSSDAVDDSFQAFLVKDAFFTSNEEYPILRKDMISKTVPQKIMPFSKAITFQGDLSTTFICFFSPDKTFERIRRNPRKYLPFFKKTAGIIGFDFSIHDDMPIIKQKAQINDNLSLTYFYGNNGVPIIPNLRCGIDELLPEFLEAIPKHSMIAIGTHGFSKKKREQCEWFCFLEKSIEVLKPSTVIAYGPQCGKTLESFTESTNFIFFEPWISQRYKEMKENVN